MNSLSIRTRLIGFITISILGLLSIGGVGLYDLHHVNKQTERIGNDWLPSIIALYNIRIALSDLRLGAYSHSLAETQEEVAKRDARMENYKKTFDDALATYKSLISLPEEAQQFEVFKQSSDKYNAVTQDILTISRDLQRKKEAQDDLMFKTREAYEDVTKQLYALRDINENGAKDSVEMAKRTFNQAITILVSVITVLAVLLMTIGVIVARSVQLGTNELTRVFNSLSKLDLRTKGKISSDDEIGKVLKQYNTTVTELTSVVKTTQEASQTVSAAALELTAGMESITTTTRHQEDALTSIAASLEETSASAQEVNTKAQRSGKATDEIVRAIGDAVQNVGELSNNASAIGSVLEMIKGISDQINLLSLNAAIEAARAGDAGRGFAVVADEVRKLATSVTTSTDQIATVVGELQNSVSRTKQTLDRVGNELDEVRSNSESVVTAVGQQTIAVNTISQSIGEFRTQMATVLNSVQEAQVASNSLSQSADNLNGQTSRFQV